MSRHTFIASITGQPRHASDIRTIIATVAARHRITAADITGRCKARWVTRPRHEAMAAAAGQGHSLKAIGAALGGLDATSVGYGIAAHNRRVLKCS